MSDPWEDATPEVKAAAEWIHSKLVTRDDVILNGRRVDLFRTHTAPPRRRPSRRLARRRLLLPCTRQVGPALC